MKKVSKKSQKILSISVAAYNLGDMIKDNLDSFIKANKDVLDKVEILVTNDGSTDNTADIVRGYERKYKGIIKLINQVNQGAGSTVNSGIRNATGKYFKMIDGDDWVETNTLNLLIPELEQIDADLVLTDMLTYNETEKKVTDRSGYDLEPKKVLKFKDVASKLDIQMHNTMYKTELLKENKIKLDDGFYTDIEYVLLPLPFVKKIAYFDAPFYVYRVARAGQSMSKASMRKNYKQHRLVLTRLINEYHANIKKTMPETRKYLIDGIGRMANTELRVILLRELKKEEKKREVMDFYDWLKEKDSDIYKSFLSGRKAKILKLTRFKALPLLEKAVEKKFY